MGSGQRGFPGELWLRTAFANAAVGLLIVDTEGRILFANDSYCNLVGRNCDDLMGLNVWSLMAPEDGAASRAAMTDLARRGSGSYTVHRRYVHKDGSIVVARGTVSLASADTGGEPVLAVVVEDETERVRLHRELEFQASLLDHVRNAVIATDCEGRITHWNRHAESIYQWTREEVIGRPILEVNTPEAALEDSKIILQTVAETGHWEGEFTARRKDHTLVPIYATLSGILDESGRTKGFVGVSNDISEWNAAQEAAKSNQTRLALALEAGDLGTWDLDFSSGRSVRSLRHDEIFGYDHPVSSWDLEAFFEHVHPEDRARVKDIVDSTIRENDGFELECRIVRPDGSVAWIWVRGKIQYDAAGRRAGLTGVIRDVTPRILREQQMQETQKLESLGLLAGGIAHDFNNLLAGIIGNASLAETTVPPDHEAQEFLRGVIQAGERAAHLTQQMLAYAGKGRLLSAAIDLNDAVRQLSSLMHSSVPNKVVLRLELAPDLPKVEGDPGQIQQVIMNLLLNAAEAIPADSEGFITIRTGIESLNGTGEGIAGALRAEPQLFLEVQDTGIGMDEATRAKIFDPFFTTKFLGRGLGLAAVQGAIRAHRGSISVSSRPGQGSNFRVLIPVGEPPKRERPAAARVPSRHSGTVLLVEDEELVRQSTAAMLSRLGYEVVTAANGREAIEEFTRHNGSFELVVLDLKMPLMGGEEALPELRRVRPGVPVILTSGYSEMEAIRVVGGPTFDGFLQKPYRPGDLAEVVQAIAGKNQPGSEPKGAD
jgi:two-component system cell cycle sensor histidine kinase/response regulator CckA